MEFDNDVKGEGNSYTTHFRHFDPRIGRWLSIDPKDGKYPSHSPYILSLNNPVFYQDRKGDDPITAVLESVAAFGLEVGMDFLSNYLLHDLSTENALKNVDWGGAVFESGKTFLISAIFPGVSTSKRINRIRKSAIGRVGINATQNLVNEVAKEYFNGTFNDENGDFDPGLLFNEPKLSQILLKSLVTALIDEGFATAAKKLQGRIDKIGEKVKKLDSYLVKNSTTMKTASRLRRKRISKKQDNIIRKKQKTISEIRSKQRKLDAAKRGILGNNILNFEDVTKKAIDKTIEEKIIKPITKKK